MIYLEDLPVYTYYIWPNTWCPKSSLVQCVKEYGPCHHSITTNLGLQAFADAVSNHRLG